jgi:outer membrane immunogenic protein
MRRLSVAVIAAASAVAFMQIASAADLPVKAPRYAPPLPPSYNWTGFYIGGNIGGSFGNADTDINIAPVTVTTNFVGSFTVPGSAGSQSASPDGIIGGGQIGYNWQFSPNWVLGLEADIQGSGEKGSSNFGNSFSFTVLGAPVTGTALADYDAKILWFGTARGRIGYAWDRLMVYATGGLAYGEVKVEGTSTIRGTVGTGGLTAPFSVSKAIGHSATNVGWTVGAGIEGALADHWTWRAEYLYMDLGSLDDLDAVINPIATASGGQTITHTHFTDNIVRVGVNYRF